MVDAQRAWAEAVIAQDVETLLALYDFGSPDAPLLFKPTLADVIRLDEAGPARISLAATPTTHDNGFLKNGWKHVEFRSAAGPILEANGLGYKDMGQYDFIKANGDITRADYTFAYHKVDGKVLITLHHSSLLGYHR